MPIKKDKWKLVPIEKLKQSQGSGLYMVYQNYWWAVDKDGNAFFYRNRTPQCNTNKTILEKIKTHPDMVDDAVFVPLAMWPVRAEDYV